MKSKRILSLVLSLAIMLGAVATPALAENEEQVTVNITAQADGSFLCAPLLGIQVSADEAENYGYEDGVDGVSALDALVKLHAIKYGESFTSESAQNYLIIGDYGSPSLAFGYAGRYSGFAFNGAYPNDGTESALGGYNGTVETTQQIKDGDTVEFFYICR